MPRPPPVAALLLGCAADPTPGSPTATAAALTCGEVSVRVTAHRRAGCPDAEHFTDLRDETAALPSDGAQYEAVASQGSNRAVLHATCAAQPAGATTTRALTFSAGVDRACGFDCAGGSAAVAFRWSGTLTIPAGTRRVRVVADTASDTERGPQGTGSVCVIETPSRAPIVLDAPHLERDLPATVGTAAVRIDCTRGMFGEFASLSCFGAPNPPDPARVSPTWATRTLTVRFEIERD